MYMLNYQIIVNLQLKKKKEQLLVEVLQPFKS